MSKLKINSVLSVIVLAGSLVAETSSAQAGWRDDAMMASRMANIAAQTAAALANGGYHRNTVRPYPTCYRRRPVYNCCGAQIGWRRVPVYSAYSAY